NAVAGEFFETARDVHLAAKDGVVLLRVLGAHQAGVDNTGVDAGANGEDLEHAQALDGLPQGHLLEVGAFAAGVFLAALFVEVMHGAMGLNGRLDATGGGAVVVARSTPEGHNTIADVFIESPIELFDGIGNSTEVE